MFNNRKDKKKLLFYALGKFQISQYLVSGFKGKSVVLCYHRIVPLENYNYHFHPASSLITSLDTFESHMKFLSENYIVGDISDLCTTMGKNKKNFKVFITFDDGYKDNLVYALPILEKYNISATIFITTRFIQNETWNWWEDIWDTMSNNESIEVVIDNNRLCYNLNSIRKKIKVYYQLGQYIMSMPYIEQVKFMENIYKDFSLNLHPNTFLNIGELKELNANKLITIGAHTHSHASLSKLNSSASKLEILQSKEILQTLLNQPIRYFAYPYGENNHIGIREIALAKELGFSLAFTTYCAPFYGDEIFNIPRQLINNNINLEKLNIILSGWNSFWRLHAA